MDAASTACRGFLDDEGAFRVHAGEIITIDTLIGGAT